MSRALAIGTTWLGRAWWRRGYNAESKLLLLTFAFEQSGAVRVVWPTDVHNTRMLTPDSWVALVSAREHWKAGRQRRPRVCAR